MTGENISRAQLLLQYYAALNELANEAEAPMSAAEKSAWITELGYGHGGSQFSRF